MATPLYALLLAGALGKIGDVQAVEPLIATLQDSDSNVRSAAAETLGKIGDARAVEPLIATLRDSHSNVRSAAAGALGLIGGSCGLWNRSLPYYRIAT